MSIRSNAKELFLQLLRAESEPEMSKENILGVIIPLLEGMGLDIAVHENEGCPAIYASTPDPEVLLNGHLDTVNMGSGWTKPHAQEIDGKIYGRGSLDMKGPCLSMLIAAEEFKEKGIGFVLVFTTDEEVGMAGAKVVAKEHPDIADLPLVIICEPTELRPVFEEKGLVQFRLTTHGKNAHGSMPEQGRNAITDLIMAVNSIQKDGLFGSNSHDPITMNLGLIKGGTLINMVPDQATAEFDIRYSPDHSEDGIMARVLEILKGLPIECDVTVERRIMSARSGLPDDGIKALSKHFQMGNPVPYATEMAVFGQINKNIFILGPGEVDRAHKPDEYMTMEEVFEGARSIVQATESIIR